MRIHTIVTAFLCLSLCSCKTWYNSNVEWTTHRINQNIEEDTAVLRFIAPYKEELESIMNVELIYSKIGLEKGKPESTLTNWFVDALQASTSKYYDNPVDFSIQNYGGIRRSFVGKGPITVGTIYEIMPFENRLVVLTMLGAEVQTMLQKMARSGGWPISSNVRFKINMQEESIADVWINGEALIMDKTYRVAMPDYVANGGDRLGLDRALPREDNQVLLREAVMEYLRPIDTLHSVPLDGRIQIINP